ncbi:MAG: glycerol-3-phosphate O-acyltransferase / dihydroxyacetone phosphate acyltransferase [Pyrinomonadaceae bacterium]|nr:glycerol-3-phosphate O-acyltransferase / dihydroxyacetone phosphate acyltransferase [Pyrinomonadaceae bacterium]
MVRRMLVAVLTLALRVFFRRIEVKGLKHVSREGATIFVLNHPNGLVDPVFLLCYAPRRVSFLAKAPIFKMPVIGFFARVLEAIPVYRHQDAGADVSRNQETFARARQLLKRGGTLAICPEGVSHSDTKLRPLKTGAARIALGVVAEDASLELKIIPAGLYYTAKTAFRSAALLRFGEPIRVEHVAFGADGEPPAEAVRALSARIESALREVTLNAEHEQALAISKRAERIFSAAATDAAASDADGDAKTDAPQSLTREVELRRRFLAGYAFHFERSPERLAELEARISRYEEQLKQAGVDLADLSAPVAAPATIARYFFTRVVPMFYWFPVALFGILVHYPAYKLAGAIAVAVARRSDDVVSTIKLIAAMLLFPLTWGALAALFFYLLGWPGVAVALVVAPVSAYVALLFFERLDGFVGGARAIRFYLTRRWFFKELLVERKRLREEMIALAEEAAAASAAAATVVMPAAPTSNTI